MLFICIEIRIDEDISSSSLSIKLISSEMKLFTGCNLSVIQTKSANEGFLTQTYRTSFHFQKKTFMHQLLQPSGPSYKQHFSDCICWCRHLVVLKYFGDAGYC